MRSLTEAELLNVWQQAAGYAPVWQALVLLTAVFPHHSLDDIANWQIGQRDACLLRVREQLFGSPIRGVVSCPQCGEKMELHFETADIQITPTPFLDTFTQEGYQVQFRLPTSADILQVAALKPLAVAHGRLLAQCLVSVLHNGEQVSVEQLSEGVKTAVLQHLSAADPQAEVQLALTCPACQHHWLALYDIVSYLWREIETWAYHLLNQIHTLALAYGWHEADILAMSPRRRQLYLELLGAA